MLIPLTAIRLWELAVEWATRGLLGRPIRPGQLPGIVVRVFLGRDLHRMFRWINTSSGTVPFSIEALRKVHPGLSTFEDWCRHNFSEASASQVH